MSSTYNRELSSASCDVTVSCHVEGKTFFSHFHCSKFSLFLIFTLHCPTGACVYACVLFNVQSTIVLFFFAIPDNLSRFQVRIRNVWDLMAKIQGPIPFHPHCCVRNLGLIWYVKSQSRNQVTANRKILIWYGT